MNDSSVDFGKAVGNIIVACIGIVAIALTVKFIMRLF